VVISKPLFFRFITITTPSYLVYAFFARPPSFPIRSLGVQFLVASVAALILHTSFISVLVFKRLLKSILYHGCVTGEAAGCCAGVQSCAAVYTW
jgi:hypothetical protein